MKSRNLRKSLFHSEPIRIYPKKILKMPKALGNGRHLKSTMIENNMESTLSNINKANQREKAPSDPFPTLNGRGNVGNPAPKVDVSTIHKLELYATLLSSTLLSSPGLSTFSTLLVCFNQTALYSVPKLIGFRPPQALFPQHQTLIRPLEETRSRDRDVLTPKASTYGNNSALRNHLLSLGTLGKVVSGTLSVHALRLCGEHRIPGVEVGF